MHRYSLTLLACLLSTSAFADDLLDIYRQARENDPQWLAAGSEFEAVKELRPQARSLLLPQASLDADYFHNRQDSDNDTLMGDDSSYDSHAYGLNLRQAIYHHEYYVQLRQADALIAQADAIYRSAEEELILRVAVRYFLVLAALDNQDFTNAELEAIERQLEQAKQRFEVGLVAITDVHEAQARRDQAKAESIRADNLLANAREELRELTGSYPASLDIVGENLQLITPEPADIEAWVKAALESNLALLAAESYTYAAEQEIQRQRAGHLPVLDLVASHGVNDVGGGNFGSRESTDTAVGVQLQVPLSSGGAVSSRTREAAHRHQVAKDQFEQARRAAERQSREAYLSTLAAISSVEALAQAVVSSQTALEAAQAGNEVGTRTIVDVLDAQSNLYAAKRDLARARYDYLLSTLRLKQATGALAVGELERINDYLVPAGTLTP